MINYRIIWRIIALLSVLFFIGGCVPSPDDPPATVTVVTPTPADTTAPEVVLNGSEGVKDADTNVSILSQDITVNFNEIINSISGIAVTDSDNNPIAVSPYTITETKVVFRIVDNLDYGVQYTVTLKDVADAAGNKADRPFTFTTVNLAVNQNSVQSLVTTGDAGKYNQLIVDPNGQQVYIAYVLDGNTIKLIRLEAGVSESNADIGTIPTDGNETMAVTMIVSQDHSNPPTSILDIVYLQANSGLHHARASIPVDKVNTWAWTTELIKSITPTLPTTIGLVRQDGDNTTSLHVSFFDETNGTLNYATDNATGWHSQVIDSAFPVGDIAGQYSSIVLDDSQQPHIAYYYFTSLNDNGDLKYAVTDDNGTSWQLTALLSTGETGQFPAISQFSGDKDTTSSDDVFDIVYYNNETTGSTTTSSIRTLNSAKGFNAAQEREIEQWDTGNSTIISMKSGINGALYAAYFNNKKDNSDFAPELKLSVKNVNIWSLPVSIDNISDPSGMSLPGYYVSSGIDINGVVHLAYYDPNESNLKYAKTIAP